VGLTMETKAETPNAARARELVSLARNHLVSARSAQTTDGSVLRALDALAEAIAVLLPPASDRTTDGET